MKKTFKLLALFLAALMLASVMGACSGGKTPEPGSTTPAPGGDDTEAPQATDAPAQPENYLDVTGVDFSNPTIVIAADDYDAMYDFAKKMQNFEIPEGTIVKIDGFAGPGTMTHTINVPNADGTGSVGTTYEVPGDFEYPEEDTEIHLVGVVRMGEYFRLLVVPAENISTVTE